MTPKPGDTQGRTLKQIRRDLQPHPWGQRAQRLKRRMLRLMAPMLDPRSTPPPFFSVLHQLLDQHEVITVDRLLDQAGEQVWGLTVLVLALLTFIPGVANVLSLATLVIGFQMMWGSPHPWMPGALRRLELHRGRIKGLLAQVESRIAWLATRRGKKRPPSQGLMGFLVAWTAFLAALPIPLPFANVLPAMALILFGAAMLEEWPSLAWLGALGSLGSTVYFAFSFDLAWKALRAMVRGVVG